MRRKALPSSLRKMGRRKVIWKKQFLKNGYPQPTELRWRHMNSVFRRCEWVFSQTYLLGRVVKYAQRTQEILFHLRKKRLDSLRRAESVSGILQEFANSSLPAS